MQTKIQKWEAEAQKRVGSVTTKMIQRGVAKVETTNDHESR